MKVKETKEFLQHWLAKDTSLTRKEKECFETCLKSLNAWDNVIYELELMAYFDGTCKASFVLNKINKHLGDVEE